MTELTKDQEALQIYQAFAQTNAQRYDQALKDIESIRAGTVKFGDLSAMRLQLAYAIESEALFAKWEDLANKYASLDMPGPGETNCIGMSSPELIKAHSVFFISRYIQEDLRPVRIWVDDDVAPYFDFNDIRVGSVSAFPVSARLPCAAFTRGMFALGPIKMPKMKAGMEVLFQVFNKSDKDRRFDSILFCTSDATARLVQEAKP